MLIIVVLLCLPNTATAAKLASKKQAASKTYAGSPYPQFRYQGHNVRWISEQMPLRIYVSQGLCLDQAGIDPAYGGPLANIDNTSGWTDLVANLVMNSASTIGSIATTDVGSVTGTTNSLGKADFGTSGTLNNLPIAPAYSEQMWQAARQGISQWKQFESEGLFSYQFTDNPQDADIYLFWTDHFVNKLGLALFASDIRGYTAKYLLAYAPVMQALNAGQLERVQFKPVVVILRTTDQQGNPMPLNKIIAAAAHEMGHVLGIDGHSTNPADLMSIYYGNGIISPNDAATIRYLYRQSPDYLP